MSQTLSTDIERNEAASVRRCGYIHFIKPQVDSRGHHKERQRGQGSKKECGRGGSCI